MKYGKSLVAVLLCASLAYAANIQDGAGGGNLVGVDGTKAMRTSPRPIDPAALGSYCMSNVTGTMAAGITAESEWMQFRWTDATRLAVITKVYFDGGGSTGTAFAAGFYRISAYVARSFSAAGTLGTTATITGSNQKLRTSFGTTLLGELRVATTAALGAGTKTLDSQAIGAQTGYLGAVPADYLYPGPLFDALAGQSYPIVLAQNEGVVLKVTVPATGTWTASATICWTEVTAY